MTKVMNLSVLFQQLQLLKTCAYIIIYIKKKKSAGMVEHLPGLHKALGSIPSTTKKKNL
jgi:hypothetical protein